MEIDNENANLLGLKYKFELIPDCEAATNAGYTKEQREKAQVFYGPTVDGDNFYYTAWHGQIFNPQQHKSSIFVCRKRKDGELVYAVNCKDYGLDTSANLYGDTSIITRCKPFIIEDTVYLTNAVISNIGPQLYAVNKKSGKLLWACAYYTPSGDFITKKGDYSSYVGSNFRLSDLNCNGFRKNGKNYLFVGTSSLQNTGNTTISKYGYSTYTDQGFLFCILDNGKQPSLYWKTPTCAPLLKTGDKIIKGIKQYDPFRANSDVVIIDSMTNQYNDFKNVYYLSENSYTSPIMEYVLINKETNITKNIVQNIWQSFPIDDIYIYQDNDTLTKYNLTDLLNLWKTEQKNLPENGSVSHFIWSYVNANIINMAKNGKNYGIQYFKYMKTGDTIDNDYDAQSLNYWGNSTWGWGVDIDKNIAYFGTGQAHSIPLDERLTYIKPENNFLSLKSEVVKAIKLYSEQKISLETLNKTKEIFNNRIMALSLDTKMKSPRGVMSYSDSIIGCYIFDDGVNKAGDMVFGVRTVQSDTYTFEFLPYPINVTLSSIDGDVSSGVLTSCNRIFTSGKSGLTVSLKFDDIKTVKFDGYNIFEKGIKDVVYTFAGPNGALGGSNYENATDGKNIYSSQGNMAWFSGASYDGYLERQVNPDGTIYNPNDSYIISSDVETGKILWSKNYGNRSHAQVKYHNNCLYTQDSSGSLYILNSHNGQILWKFDGKNIGLNGGIVAPSIHKNEILWLNNYYAFGIIGNPGPNGACFVPMQNLLVKKSLRFLVNKKYLSWDTFPKYNNPNPAIEPINQYTISHLWKKSSDVLVLTAKHKNIITSDVTILHPTCSKFSDGILSFHQSNDYISYNYIKFINKNTYLLCYTFKDNKELNYAWLRVQDICS